MAIVEFSGKEKEEVLDRIQFYFEQELAQELGRFDAEFLMDYFSQHMGRYYYNKGLEDAQSMLIGRIAMIAEDIEALQKVE